MLKRFKYTKANGDESQRTVFVVSPPSDGYLTIDLSEYDKEEQDYYEGQLQAIHNEFLEEIRILGLSTNWRNFKESRISPPQED